MLFDDSGISEYTNNQSGGQYQPTKHTVFKSGEQREIRQTLRNADRKRIQYCTGKADMGSYVYHAQPGDGVISHWYGKWDDDDDEGQCLFTHTEYGTEKAEKDDD